MVAMAHRRMVVLVVPRVLLVLLLAVAAVLDQLATEYQAVLVLAGRFDSLTRKGNIMSTTWIVVIVVAVAVAAFIIYNNRKKPTAADQVPGGGKPGQFPKAEK
jgi:hypothetical protein